LLDRIDMHIEVAPMPPAALGNREHGEASTQIAQRVAKAYQLQLARQGKSNQRLSAPEIDQTCRLDKTGEQLLMDAMNKLLWSARAYHRVLKVARTIADLAGEAAIATPHVAEAIQYRRGLRER
jgi:magnesium chelatase family protein